MSTLFAPFRSLPRFRQLTDDKFHCQCPAHDDHSPSLRGTTRNGRLLLRCWAGCTVKDVLGAMGLPWGALFAEGYKPPTAKERLVATEARRKREAFDTWRIAEIGRLGAALCAYDAFLGLGPWESLTQVQRAFLGAVARDYAWTEWQFERLSMGGEAALEVWREQPP